MKFISTSTSGIVILFLLLGQAVSCIKNNSPAPAVPVQVSAISPMEGPGGTTVTIRGAGFSAMSAADSVYFNGMGAAVSFADDSILQVTVPKLAGSGAVSVKVKGTTVTGPSFTYDYQGVVSTFAGKAGGGGTSDGTGLQASFSGPWGIAVDGSGNLYVADYYVPAIRMVTPGAKVTTMFTLANNPIGVALDGKGNLYVTQGPPTPGVIKYNLALATGTIISGGNAAGFQNAVSGLLAQFEAPNGLAVDKKGNVYVADDVNQLIRVVATTSTYNSTATFAGLYKSPGAVDGGGSIATFDNPAGLAFDTAGNLYVADAGNNMIRKITPDTTVSTVAGAINFGYADGIGAAAGFSYPTALAADSKGNLYVVDNRNNIIRMITPAGMVTTIAGNGHSGSADGIGAAATFSSPNGIACDVNGTLWVTEGGSNIIRKIIVQ